MTGTYAALFEVSNGYLIGGNMGWVSHRQLMFDSKTICNF